MKHIKKAQSGKRLIKKSDYMISERGDTLRGKSAEAARKHQRDYTKWLEENIRPMEPRAAAAWDAAKKKREATAPKKKMKVGGTIKKAQNGTYKSRTVERNPEGTYKMVTKSKTTPRGEKTSMKETRTLKGVLKGVPKKTSGIDKNPSLDMDLNKANYERLRAKNGKQMLKRADGSYSRRGLWDNIRANRGSGRKPTAAMLKQERKIKSKK